MIKRFLNKHGFRIVVYLIAVAIFISGFLLGKYGQAASSLEEIELAEISPLAEVESVISTSSVYSSEAVSTSDTSSEANDMYRKMTVKATAYCSCKICCGKTDGITATGTKVKEGRTIAVNPSYIEYGSEVIINGHTYIAEDCVGVPRGNKIDIYFNSHAAALSFGRQTLTVFVKG